MIEYKFNANRLIPDVGELDAFYSDFEKRLYDEVLGDYIFTCSEASECVDRIVIKLNQTLRRSKLTILRDFSSNEVFR